MMYLLFEYYAKLLEKQVYMQGMGRHSIEDVRRMIVEVNEVRLGQVRLG
jgi:hypothetical protein